MPAPVTLLLAAGSTVLAVADLASMWLIACHRRSGWVIGLATEALWFPYDIATQQYGFLALMAVSIPVYVRGWRNFAAGSRARRLVSPDSRP